MQITSLSSLTHPSPIPSHTAEAQPLTPTLDRRALLRAAWRAEPTDTAYQAFLTFSDRASYLAWVVEWKAQYAEVVAEIRAAKAVRRDITESIDTRCSAQNHRQSLRSDAHTFLMLRIASKVASGQQRARAQNVRD